VFTFQGQEGKTIQYKTTDAIGTEVSVSLFPRSGEKRGKVQLGISVQRTNAREWQKKRERGRGRDGGTGGRWGDRGTGGTKEEGNQARNSQCPILGRRTTNVRGIRAGENISTRGLGLR